ncbi:MAG TPA: glutamate dehydrogenase, partial [Candidatus Paceibacterota bacterium]|nr:glutamate dehydrogenase [Candidatus Paceibacterota bacterium]
AFITGKPVEKGGSAGRDTATADGAHAVLIALLADQHRSLQELRAAVQGAGNAGAQAARLIERDGGRVVAIADSHGTIHNPAGLDVEMALHAKELHGSVCNAKEDEHAEMRSPEAVITTPCDILVPAALEEQVRADNVEDVKTDIVLEIANGPVTPEADDILARRNVAVVPDVLANAGGVTVSYFEWLQNRAGESWTGEQVAARLHETMRDAYRDVADFALDRGVTLRQAAYALAVQRILNP